MDNKSKLEIKLQCGSCQHTFYKIKENDFYGFCPKCGVEITTHNSSLLNTKPINNNSISLSTPWGTNNVHFSNIFRRSASCKGEFSMGSENEGELSTESNTATKSFIEIRTKLHLEYIKETEKTKRFTLIIAAILFSLAIIVIVFSPKEKESLSYWVGGALLIISAGAAGFKRLFGKAKFLEFRADQEKE